MYDSYAERQRREQYRNVELQQKRDAAERERQHRNMLAERERSLQERIALRLEENARKRLLKEAAEEQQQTERGERVLARVLAERAGVPYTSSRGSYDNPTALWKAAVAECVLACHGNRQNGVIMANRRNPGLREKMLQSVNGGRF